jgi:cell division cycle 2-like protein
MSAKPKSRWANTEQDAELDAKLKLEKEEKRRKKAEKAQKLAEEEEAARRNAAAAQQTDNTNHDDPSRPSKRRKLTPEPPSSSSAPPKLLRFDPPSSSSLAPSRSVDHYDKLNDIEEGTYGFVARATELSTGRVVAIKRLKLEPADPNGLPVTGLREIQILKRCQHRNVVKLEEVVVGNDIGRPDK